jgi:hypothetical protein
LGDSKLTSEKFFPNPFTGAADDRLYKTGDVGRYLPDGSVEFVGRSDFQVKVRGFRVELGEIEARLKSHPLVRAAAAAVQEHPSGSKQLVGYVVLDQEQAGWQGALHKWLAEKLPDYMAPGAIVVMDEMPLTPNGKVDRKALPAPEGEWLWEEGEHVAPATGTEKALARIWAELLQRDERESPQYLVLSRGESFHPVQVQPQATEETDRISDSIRAPLEHLDFVVKAFDPAAV